MGLAARVVQNEEENLATLSAQPEAGTAGPVSLAEAQRRDREARYEMIVEFRRTSWAIACLTAKRILELLSIPIIVMKPHRPGEEPQPSPKTGYAEAAKAICALSSCYKLMASSALGHVPRPANPKVTKGAAGT